MYNIVKKLFALFPLCFLGLSVLNAQKNTYQQGYYISNVKKDTIRGFFDNENLTDNKIIFSTKEDMTDSKTIYPTDIQMIKLSGLTILPKVLSLLGVEETIFVSTLLSGDVNLYGGVSKKEGDVFFINAVDRPDLKRINKTDPKTFFKIYFDKCKNTKLYDVSYNRGSIKNAVINYSRDCYGTDIKDIKTPKTSFIRGIDLGVTSSLSLYSPRQHEGVIGSPTYINLGKFQTKVAANIGLMVRFDLSKTLSIGTGLSLLKKSFESKDTMPFAFPYNDDTYYGKAWYKISFNVLEIPLEATFRFYQVKSSYKPFISFSYSLWKPFNLNAVDKGVYYERVNITGFTESYPKTPDHLGIKLDETNFQGRYFCASTKAGFMRTINNSQFMELGMKYSYERELFNDFSFYSHRTSIFLNYLFSFQKKIK